MSTNPYEPSRVAEPRVIPAVRLPFEIEFEFTLDDYVAYNQDFYQRSTGVRAFTGGTFLIIGVGIGVAAGVYLATIESPVADDIFPAAMFGVLGVTAFVFIAIWTFVRGPLLFLTEPLIRHMATRGDTSSLFGRYTIRITDQDILERAPQSEHRFAISAVQKIILAREHIFLYVSPIQAFIIPRRAFADPREPATLVELLEQVTGKRAIR